MKTLDLFTTQYDIQFSEAIAMPLSEKIDRAIALIQKWDGHALDLSPNGYYVAFSGGKDSIVQEKLFAMAGVKYQAWYNNTTIDPPELVRFINRQYPQVRKNNPKRNLPMQMKYESQGPPTRKARWCCEMYKEQGGNGMFVSTGVRALESPRRKNTWREITHDMKHDSLLMCPIIYWSEDEIWQFIRDNKMPYCELYDEGWKRLGCIGCPMSGPAGQTRDFARWPKYEAMWKRGFQAYWDTWKGVPRLDGKPRWIERFPNIEAFWNWWRSGKAFKEGSECQAYQW